MGQKGFFDVERRLEAISAKGDPLETIKKMVRWEDFRADIEAVTETKPEERKSNAGRKPTGFGHVRNRPRLAALRIETRNIVADVPSSPTWIANASFL